MTQEKYPSPSPIEPGNEMEILKKMIMRVEEINEKEKDLIRKERVIRNEIKNCLEEFQRSPNFAPPVSTRDEVKEVKKLEPSQQIGALISIVFEKGLGKAISLAQSLDDPAVLDEFHDTLIDRYYQILVQKRIIK